MSQRIATLAAAVVMSLGATYVAAKIPPPPPLDEKGQAAAEAKKEKDKAAAAKAKADLQASEERAIQNYHGNLRKQGKPIPKAIAVAAQSSPPKGGEAKPESNTTKVGQQVKKEAAQDAAKGKK